MCWSRLARDSVLIERIARANMIPLFAFHGNIENMGMFHIDITWEPGADCEFAVTIRSSTCRIAVWRGGHARNWAGSCMTPARSVVSSFPSDSGNAGQNRRPIKTIFHAALHK